MPRYQTLSEFLRSPFNNSSSLLNDTENKNKYIEFSRSNKIRIEGYCIIEDSYYIHVKVPSESQKDGKYEYDVVIRFFTDKPEIKKESSLRNYYIQFFSNSPGFIYKYAYLYNKEGFLIELLQNKLDSDFSDVSPEKTNAKMELSYDKTIFFACMRLSELKFRVLNKTGVLLQKKKNPNSFFSGINDFKSVKVDHELLNSERRLNRELKKNEQRKKSLNTGKKPVIFKKTHGITTAKIIEPKQSSVHVVKKKSGVKKITSKKTTRKIT